MHTPLNPDTVLDAMSALSDLMTQQGNALMSADLTLRKNAEIIFAYYIWRFILPLYETRRQKGNTF